MVIGRAMLLVAAGAGGAFALSKYLKSLLFEPSPAIRMLPAVDSAPRLPNSA
jgi:hypothetical protein